MSELPETVEIGALRFWPVGPEGDKCETPGRPFLIGWHEGTRAALVTRPNCGLWSCPHCAQLNASRWTARAIRGAQQLLDRGENLYFLTLTHRGGISPARSRQRWRDCWPKLSARMRRAQPRKVEYLYVHEQHKSGVMHTHVTLTGTWTERWWKDNPARTGFGYMNDLSVVDSAVNAGSYVAKYLAKMLQLLQWPPGWRRLGTSRGWPVLPPAERVEGWQWLAAKFAQEVRAEIESLALQGYRIEILDDKDLVDSFLTDYSKYL
jgi:hypothetical protein